jgi:hypothetical protein
MVEKNKLSRQGAKAAKEAPFVLFAAFAPWREIVFR